MYDLFSDMDGVLTDFVRPSLRLHGRDDLADTPRFPAEYNYWNLIDMSEDEFWRPVKAAGEAWWASLPGTDWHEELLSLICLHFPKWEVATKPTRARGCLEGKRRWVDRVAGRRIMHYTEDKSRLSAPGRILLDDYEPNITNWEKFGGVGILVPAPYNKLVDLYVGGQVPQYLSGELVKYV